MQKTKRWELLKNDRAAAARLADGTGVSALLARVLAARGACDAEKVRNFLSPSLQGLHDPFLMHGMEEATCIVAETLALGRKIAIYGDYDVDGVTCTAILLDFLGRLGAETSYYIPDRMDEGYGLSIQGIDILADAGVHLMITADCGITANAEISHAQARGMKVVLTDHHRFAETIPEADAVVHPGYPGGIYPYGELAGVGVVMKLVTAICKKVGIRDMQNDYLDLAALGTIADVVPLTGENRVIAHYGIQAVRNTGNVGLRALIECSGMRDKPVNSWLVGYVLSPRINAAGRMGNAGRAVRLFTTGDAEEAGMIAADLNNENRYRQDTEMVILQQAMETLDRDPAFGNEKVLVVSGDGWHHGIVGIVASKVADRTGKPCIMLCCDGDTCRGSARSIEGFDIYKALGHCSHLLEKYGGHEMAAGLSMKKSNIDRFRECMNLYADTVIDEFMLQSRIVIDSDAAFGELTLDNARELDRLAPFGCGNPAPVISTAGLRICDIRTVGEGGRHLKVRFREGGKYIDAIGFGMGELCRSFHPGDAVEAAFLLETNIWNSVERVQMNLRDLRPLKN